MNGLNVVSAGAGVVALIAAAIIAWPGQMQWPRVCAALVLTGSAGIINGTIGSTIHNALTKADAMAADFIGEYTGVAISGVLSLALLGTVAFWIWRNQIDMRTLGAVAAIPPTVTLIPGMLGTAATTIVGVVPWILSVIISYLFGWR